MTIPATGPFSSETVRAEYGLGLPMSSEQLRVAAGLGLPYSSENLRGLSSFSVDFTVGAQQDVAVGSPVSGNRRAYKLMTAVVSGGSGSYTYAWSQVGATYSTLLSPTLASCQFTQSYNTAEFPETNYQDSASVTLQITDTSTGLVRSVTKTVTLEGA